MSVRKYGPNYFQISTGTLTVEGSSRAGVETWLRVKQLGIALDIGRCPDLLVGVDHVFLSHAHIDHALGVPFHAAQRALQSMQPASIYVPAENASDYRELMRLHEKLEHARYPVEIVGLDAG